MKRAALTAAALILLCACSKTPQAVVYGTVDFLKDSTFVLNRLASGTLQPADTVNVASDGTFKAEVSLPGEAPSFYYLCSGTSTLATVVLLPGDKVKLQVTADGFSVEGSDESALLKEINLEFDKARKALADNPAEAGKTYVNYKRFAVKHLVDHPYSITSAALAFQKFSDQLPVFGEVTDAIILNRLYDSVKMVYPTSEYVLALGNDVEVRKNNMKMSMMLNSATASSFPDLNMPDIEGNMKALSEMSGKVIILSFWSPSAADQKMFNITLSNLFGKYHDRGLEIYQVAVDVDKPKWASTVKSQNIKWTSVNDGYGNQSPAIASYNVTAVPTMFVIGRNGEFAGRDIFNEASLEKLIEKLL